MAEPAAAMKKAAGAYVRACDELQQLTARGAPAGEIRKAMRKRDKAATAMSRAAAKAAGER